MIGKLRFKLVLASMLSLVFVLAVILGTASVLNYRKITGDADGILEILKENDGSFPQEPHSEELIPSEERAPKAELRFSPELPYESRFFSVFFAEDGSILSVNTGKIAAVDTAEAMDYAVEVLDSGAERGFAEDYRYIVYSQGEETHMIFLDYGREMSAFRSFLFTSAVVSALGLLAVLLLVFLSGRIVEPFSENYEKQRQFITNAGHELKTPLTIIAADTEVLEMDMGENEWLGDIRSQTKRLAQLTNSLIQLSRMEEQPQAEKISFPLSDLVEESLESFQTLARTQGKELLGHVQPMLSMTGDEKAIGQLLGILLDNAVKYSDDGGRIELSLEKQKNQIRLSVFNTAQSVPRESLGHLFDRFYRADSSRNSGTGGYGLGLSIALAIVTAHKGKISASTSDEKSLLINVVFPLDSRGKAK